MNDEENLATTRENTSRNDLEGSPVPMSKGSLLNKENLQSTDVYRSPQSGITQHTADARPNRITQKALERM